MCPRAPGKERDSRVVKATHIGTCRQHADSFPAGPSAVWWQSAGPDVTVVVPASEKKVLSQEMDLLKRGKDKKKPFLVEQKNIVSSAQGEHLNVQMCLDSVKGFLTEQWL